MRTHTYDPFAWRIERLANPDLDPERRAQLLEGLLVAEAEELAMGRRHLTIAHGEPTDIAEAEALNDFYNAVAEIAEEAEWSRLRGGRDYLTITVSGARRDEVLGELVEISCRTDPQRRALECPRSAPNY
jgi:hypothetical protein